MSIQLIGALIFSILVGIIIGRFMIPKGNASVIAGIFEMFSSDESDDNMDRTLTLIGAFFVVVLILILVFITDWFFNGQTLTDTVIGILIGTSLAWITSAVTHFFRANKG